MRKILRVLQALKVLDFLPKILKGLINDVICLHKII